VKVSRKYLVAVALLAVLAVVFGLAGTVAPMPESVSPQQESSSSSVAHFMNPPTYDSGWVDITTKTGQYFNITHNLGTKEVFVDIQGKQSLTGTDGEHQRNLGGTGSTPGWNRTYGATGSDVAGAGASIVQTFDEGYAIAGNTNSSGAGLEDFWLVKTDSAGKMQWNRTYGGASGDFAESVVQTFDGGYALAGYTTSNVYPLDEVRLVKVDSAGNMLWSQTYGRYDRDHARSVVQATDGGFAIAGRTWNGGRWYDFWLIKTNSSGDMEWNQIYGGIGATNDYASSLFRRVTEDTQ
jgi:hypothetical protein